ncbi:MAG: methyltransferase domain-containing protein [Phycisphaerae bacterium]|nr:methyltransferase domain-containing protein [Phycisphaerae bacterium]
MPSGPWIVDRRPDTTLVVSGGAGSPEPMDWAAALTRAGVRHGPDAVIVTKRITPEGTLSAMGEYVVHPKGLHSVGHGLDACTYRFPKEVDGALTGAAVFPSAVVADFDEPRGAFGLLEWCLRARVRGARIVAVPEVVWIAGEQPMRINSADIDAFAERFGFHPFAPDIDAIAARSDLARLRWNVRFWGTAQPFEKYAERGAFHWTAYQDHPQFRSRADFLLKLALEAFSSGSGPLLDVGCGDGLYGQLIVERSAGAIPAIGIDDDCIAIEEAQRVTADRAPQARFVRGSVYALPADPASARGVLLLDVLEHLHNPAKALRELARVIAPDGVLLASTPEWQFGHASDPTYHSFEFTSAELHRLLTAEGQFRIERTARIGGAYRDLVVLARRT